jgi:hypothetical protein
MQAQQRPNHDCRRLFMPAISCNGDCVWETFGPVGFLYLRFINLRTAATPSPDNERGSFHFDMRVLSIQKSAFPFSTPWPFTSPELPNDQSPRPQNHRPHACLHPLGPRLIRGQDMVPGSNKYIDAKSIVVCP